MTIRFHRFVSVLDLWIASIFALILINLSPALKETDSERIKMLLTVDDLTMAISLGAVAASLVYLAVRSLEAKKPFAELPMAEGSHWLYGHIRIMLGDDFRVAFKRLFMNSANSNGLVGFWFFGLPVLGVSTVRDARTVLAAEHERRPPALVKHFSRHFIGEKNLLMINGKEWK